MGDFDDTKDVGEEKEINLDDDFFMDDAIGDEHEDMHDDSSPGEEEEEY